MTAIDTSGSGSGTNDLINKLVDELETLKNAPPFKRAGLAAAASESIVVVLRDLDRRIQQLETVESDQQDDRNGDVSALPRAGRRSQK